MASNQSSQQSGSTFFGSNPIADPLAELGKQATNQYMGFVQDPTAHPLFQSQIGGLLQSLIPSENRARTGLTDMFRSAGGLRSGSYGREATQLEDSLMQRRSQTAAQLLGQMFPQMVQALNNPIAQIPNLLQALKLSQSSGSSQGSSTDPQGGGSYGGGGGSYGLNSNGMGGGWNGGQLASAGEIARMNAMTGSNPHFTGYGSSPQTQAPMNQPMGQPYQPYLDPWGSSSQQAHVNPQGQLISEPVDQYGFTQQDWANDPYFN